MKGFRKTLRQSVMALGAILFAGSLLLNGAMLMSEPVHATASSAFEAVTGLRTVARSHADRVATLSADLAAERGVTQDLYAEIAELSHTLVMARQIGRDVRDRFATLSAELADSRRLNDALRAEIAALADQGG